ALKTIFDQVYDQTYIQELFSLATEFYLQDKRNDPSQRWPIISPICPVVNRLIYYRFPALLPHLLPFLAPREISARELRKKLLERSSFRPEEIGVYHITPCSAKMLSIKSPLFLNKSHLDGVIGINEVFTKTRSSLGHISDEVIYHYSSGVGIGWAKSGGEISAIDGARTLAVSGIKETITYLEKIELGLLNGIEYLEFRACHEGCIGGQLTAVDKYEAKRTTDRLVRMFGIEKRVRPQYVRKLYESGFFTAERELATLVNPGNVDIIRAINRAKEVQSLWELLPQKECGACGSPDCMTFAEDVIDGLQTPDRCFFLREMRSWN
ncbi:MAG: [Fe-Fe] hydrogenase large subunit C-terminal domain-containing protein, partial [Desulfatiglandales bacterium]